MKFLVQKFGGTSLGTAARLRAVADIVRASAREITVISRSRAVTGSEMRMRVSAAGGRQATLRVRTTGSQPQLVGGQLRYRLWMQVLSQESEVTA